MNSFLICFGLWQRDFQSIGILTHVFFPPRQIFVMNNYFCIGLDADLCYAFHTEREHKPHKFNSRLHNKTVYVKVSLQKMVGRGLSKDLRKDLQLEVDGKVVDLPNIKGIIILNIMR